MFFCERTGKKKYKEIGSLDFLKRLKDSKFRQIIVYVHGFSNLPEDVFSAVSEFQGLCEKTEKNEVLAVPLVWPCDNDFGIVKDYWDDQKAADQSAYSFARVLEKFLAWRNSEKYNPQDDPCLKRINVLAHSYFRSGLKKGSPGRVFEHIFSTIVAGRVFPEDERGRSTIIKLKGSSKK